jgi:hypothetical protein
VQTLASFSWTGSAAPWWVTPTATLAGVWFGARANERKDRRAERRRAAVEQSDRLRELLGLDVEHDPFVDGRKDYETAIALFACGFNAWDVSAILDVRRGHEATLEAQTQAIVRAQDVSYDALPDEPFPDFPTSGSRAARRWGDFAVAMEGYLTGRSRLRRVRRAAAGSPRQRLLERWRLYRFMRQSKRLYRHRP